jgi:hypothetical protein
MIVDSRTGKKTRQLGGRELERPVGMAAAPFDQLLVASHKGNAILRYNVSTAAFVDVFAGSRRMGPGRHPGGHGGMGAEKGRGRGEGEWSERGGGLRRDGARNVMHHALSSRMTV